MVPTTTHRDLAPARRLLPLTLTLVAVAGALWLGPVSITSTHATPAWAAFAALTAAFALTESTQIHVELNRQTVSLSLSELPLVLGLFVVDPLPLLAARLAGALVVAAVRRTAAYKVAFNTALFTVEVGLLVLIAGQVSASDGATTWWRTFLAVMAATTVSGLLLLVAVRLLHGPLASRDAVRTLVPLLCSAVLNTSLALIVVVLLQRDPAAAGLLVVVALALVGAYRTYSVLLRRHRSLELLHDFMVGVTASRSPEQLVETVLSCSRELLSADTALLLPGARLVGPARCSRRTTPRPSGRPARTRRRWCAPPHSPGASWSARGPPCGTGTVGRSPPRPGSATPSAYHCRRTAGSTATCWWRTGWAPCPRSTRPTCAC